MQITVAETVGVELRARFYEATGALRDMVPNHVFQLLSLTAMEPPNSFDADAVRTEKHKVLEAVHPLDDAEVRRNTVRGQYGAGNIEGTAGRRPIARSPVSLATARPRPMSRCGSASTIGAGPECLFICAPASGSTRRTTEIAIQFKQAPFALFRDTPVDILTPNVLALQLQPDEGRLAAIRRKDPGAGDRAGRRADEFLLQGLLQDRADAPATKRWSTTA